jgi:beta-glucosidase
MTKILREELGFRGIVLCEGDGIGTLIYEQIVPGMKEAGVKSINAGIDVGIWFEEGFMGLLKESVEEGLVSLATLDKAVRRILEVKFKLGLFENPYADDQEAVRVIHSAVHQETAFQAARESMVLLKNEGNLLPLSKNISSIAVIGPNADNKMNQLGDYFAKPVQQEIVTVLEGIKKAVGQSTEIRYVKGCNVIGNEVNELEKAVEVAEKSDVAIVVVGENERYSEKQHGMPTNGEGFDVASLDLTGMQTELVKKVAETGTPTIVVLINGRPLSTRWIAENIPAILEAWLPGEKGGIAVAEVLFGDYNPDGRLPVTIPRHVGQLPCYYFHGPSKELRINNWYRKGMVEEGYVDMPITPLYHFGHGLSYTNFKYSNIKIIPTNPGPSDTINISVDVENIGHRQGGEVVQLYIDDVISSVSTPVIELRGFKKIWLAPEEKQTVNFILTPKRLALLDKDMNWVVEPGVFKIMIGHSSDDIRLTGEFEVQGKGM